MMLYETKTNPKRYIEFQLKFTSHKVTATKLIPSSLLIYSITTYRITKHFITLSTPNQKRNLILDILKTDKIREDYPTAVFL